MALVQHVRRALDAREARYVDRDWLDGADLLDRPRGRVLFVECAPGTIIRGTRSENYLATGSYLPDTHGLVSRAVRAGKWVLPHECTKLYPTVFVNVGHPKMLRRALRRLKPGGKLVIRGRELLPLLQQLFASAEARETITGSIFSVAKNYQPVLRVLRQLDAVAQVWEPSEESPLEAWAPSESLSYSEVAWLAARQI